METQLDSQANAARNEYRYSVLTFDYKSDRDRKVMSLVATSARTFCTSTGSCVDAAQPM